MTGREVDPREVLAAPMPEDNDAGVGTIGEYLVGLLTTLWTELEGFSGKRPFGNSGWDFDLLAALIRADFIDGEFDDDGYLEVLDDSQDRRGRELIMAAIKALGAPS
jgi:hypothetical protein